MPLACKCLNVCFALAWFLHASGDVYILSVWFLQVCILFICHLCRDRSYLYVFKRVACASVLFMYKYLNVKFVSVFYSCLGV